MESFITYCIAGFIAFDEKFNIINHVPFKKSEIALNMIKIANKSENELIEEEIKIIEEIPEEYTIINIESNKRKSDYKDLSNYEKIKLAPINSGGEYLRSNLEKTLIDTQFLTKTDNEINNENKNNNNNNKSKGKSKSEGSDRDQNQSKINTSIVNNYTKIAILKIKESSQEEDKLVIQAINSIDEIDESISKLVERIREWNNIYFPEIDIIQNNESYINLIAENENREETLKNLPESIQIDVSESNGADIENEDIEIINNFAKSIQSLQKSRIAIENYIDQKMEKIAPNLRGLIGSSLGAKLISHIGSLKRLAMCSSSTVQIIGAEKALFRHLKTGERPPKHGLIFQHPEVRTAPWWIRGKIARTLSLKISLAIRKDVFSGDFDPTISESFLEKVKEIKKENPFPTKTKKRIEEERTGKRSSKTSKKQLKKHKKKYKKKRKKKKKK